MSDGGDVNLKDNFQELVKKASKGDSNAFAELYSAIYKELYYYALTNLNSPDDAADAVQDAVLDAFMGIKNLKNEDAFKGWIIKILTAKIKKRQAEYVAQRENLTYVDAGDRYDDDEDKASLDIPYKESKYEEIELLEQLECLSENEKLCFSLNAIYGYRSEEIEKLTGINAATVRTHLARGKAKLRKLLDET